MAAVLDKPNRPEPRVWIFRPGALGDTVLTEPAVASIRARYPGARIEIAGRTDYLPLLVGPGLADACVSMDAAPFTSLFTAGPLALPPCDLVVAYFPDRDGMLTRRLSSHAGRAVVFDPIPPEKRPVHVVDHLLAALEPLGISPVRREPHLRCREVWRRAARALCPERGYVVIHPGSGGRGKLWDAEKWAEVVGALRPRRVVLTCGPADAEVVAAVLARLGGDSGVSVVREPPVTTLAGVLAGARAYLGCDSGVTHLASALGVATVSVFGPTDPGVWGPRGGHVRVLRGEAGTIVAVTPADVLDALGEVERRVVG